MLKSEVKRFFMGLILVLLGIIYFALLGTMDATAGVFLIAMGILVMIFKF